MNFSLSPFGRSVLLVSDEALYVYQTGSSGVRLIEVVPWDADNFERNVAAILSKECKGRPALVLVDTLEQHYRKERIARAGVGMMDRSAMLQRKVQMVFPNHPIRSSLVLDEKVEKTKNKPADVFILAAVPDSDNIKKTVEALRLSLVSVIGFALLPVESSDMVKALSEKVSKGRKAKSRWVVFMGAHKGGGLRQIVIKDGQLALTRMTPLSETDAKPSAWAHEVHKEFKATMSYLLRFGYKAEDGLDMIVVSDSAAGKSLEALVEDEYDFFSLTHTDAAALAGVSLARGQQDELAVDAIHVGWAGKKRQLLMSMAAPTLEAFSKTRTAAMLAAMALVVSALVMFYMLVSSIFTASSLGEQIDAQNKIKAQLDAQYQREVQQTEALGFDARLLNSSIEVYQGLEARYVDILGLARSIAQSLDPDMSITNLALSRPERSTGEEDFRRARARRSAKAEGQPSYALSVQFSFPGTINVERGNNSVIEFRRKLQEALSDHEVKITKLLRDYEYNETVTVGAADERDPAKQSFTAEVVITKVKDSNEN